MIAAVAVAVMVVRTDVRSPMRVLAPQEVLMGMPAVVAPAVPPVTVGQNGGKIEANGRQESHTATRKTNPLLFICSICISVLIRVRNIPGGQLLAFTDNETPDGVSGTKGAYDAEIAGSQIPIV